MKFKSTIDALSELLNYVAPIVPQKSTVLVLQYLNFNLSGNTLSVIATNEEISILKKIEVEGLEDGSVLVPSKKFNDIIKSIGKGGEVTFTCDTNSFEIEFKYGKGKFKLKGIDSQEYISLEGLFENELTNISNILEKVAEGELFAKFEEKLFAKLTDRTLFAVSTEDYKPAMTGVFFQFRENQLTVAATDGYRLNRYIHSTEENAYPKVFDVVIPSSSLELLRKIDAEMIMSVLEEDDSPKYLRFDFENTILTTRIINEKFPPYETIIPNDYTFTALVPLNELISATKRVSLTANTVSKLMILNFANNQLTLNTQDDETGEFAEESLPCEIQFEKFEIGVKYDYFLQSLQHLYYDGTSEDVLELRFNDPAKAFIICPKNEYETFIMLNMPVRYK
ncbi:MAG: DNA polymerase III subunit beta [Ignavibacteria bacterium GWF2_33_9]|nr:MAG: DNA polymerase III subunit beta [Ignavibacteria bacterium GWF2_33_9]